MSFNPRTREECDSRPQSERCDKRRFNPRTREECDVRRNVGRHVAIGFNPRTREECDMRGGDDLRTVGQVSIHALARSATRFALAVRRDLLLFQSTHSRGVRLALHQHCVVGVEFQSTHSRGVRHARQAALIDRAHVSIHALARSATAYARLQRAGFKFQSTHSRGVRPDRPVHSPRLDRVSIHALARSATATAHRMPCLHRRFNPRTREECDRTVPNEIRARMRFQSTHSRGVRQRGTRGAGEQRRVSIHALARSATAAC